MRHLLSAVLILILLATGQATPVAAQVQPAQAPAQPAQAPSAPALADIDFEAWEVDARRAENIVEAATASTAFLQNLRSALVSWRARLLAAQDANAARIQTIQAQIDALGPPPAEGATEPEAIAQRRAELNDRLAAAQVPRLTAIEAYNRAEGLIAEIDRILAQRQARELLQRDPAPVNPLNWPPSLVALGDLAVTIEREVADRVTNRPDGNGILERAPIALVLVALGLLLSLRSRHYVGLWTERMQLQVATRRGRGALAFLISLLQVALPIIGLILIGAGIWYVDLLGPAGQDMLEAIITAGVTLILGLWLAGRLFPYNPELRAALNVSDELRAPLHRAVFYVALFLGLGTIAEAIAAQDVVPLSARGVLVLPVYLGLSFTFLRLVRLLRRHRLSVAAASTEGESEGMFVLRSLAVLGWLVRVVAWVAPAVAAIGYLNLAEQLMTPTAVTMGLVGLLVALQSPIRDVYALIAGKSADEVAQALLPVLVNLLLVFASVPVLLLIWGMRPEQLSEVITRFTAGFQLGDTRITPGILLAVIAVFALGIAATRLLQGAMRATILPRTKLDVGARNAVVSGLGYVGIALAAVIAITTAGIDLTALGVVLGALSVGIGFGLQNVVNNFVSGIILLIERPISEGDWIEVGPTMGIVKAISVRSTTIETFDKTDVIVPNADLISGTVTNWTRGNTIGRAIVTVGVAYGTDTRRVERILFEIANSQQHVTKFPPPGVDFLGFGADSLEFRIRMILRDVNNLLTVKNEVHHRIAERFAEEGIEIPFAQREIWLRNPEALRLSDPSPPEDGRAPAEAGSDGTSADGDAPDRPVAAPGSRQGPLPEDMD